MRFGRGQSARLFSVLAVFALVVAFSASASVALAGKSATGEPLFYPCTSCHPVDVSPAGRLKRRLPNNFKGHKIVLVGHNNLGRGRAACLVCHDDPTRNPGKLKLVDGSLVDIMGDVSRVCYRCHSAKYNAWKAGTHGKHKPKCTAAGCHDPHTPQWIYVEALPPLVGTGFQAQLLPEKQPFKPLAGPPAPVPTDTPGWLVALTAIGVVLAGGIATRLVQGRSKA